MECGRNLTELMLFCPVPSSPTSAILFSTNFSSGMVKDRTGDGAMKQRHSASATSTLIVKSICNEGEMEEIKGHYWSVIGGKHR